MPRALSATLVAAVMAFAAPANSQPLSIGTTPPGTLVHALGTTIATMLTAADLPASVQATNGTSVLIPKVNSGEFDMGFCGAQEFYDSFHGAGSSDKRPNPNLRAVAVLFPNRLGLLVRNDSPIKGPGDLKGARVTYGYGDQASGRTGVEALLANAGLTLADVRPIDVPSLTAGIDALINGAADVAFFSIGQAKVAEADAAIGVRFLPIDVTPPALAAMQKVLPTAYVGHVEPATNLKGIRAPIQVAQYDVLAFTNASMPELRAKAVTRLIADQRDTMAQSLPVFRQLRPERMFASNLKVPYHDGAIAYYRDKGIKAVP